MNTVTIDFDEWDVVTNNVTEKTKEYLDFNTPPLALVIAMQEAGKLSYEIYDTLVGLGKNPHIRADTAIDAKHQAAAAKMYDHFAKKYTLRRIKGEYISPFMLAVDDLCQNRKRVDTESLKILLSLPKFYNQNCALERVMKGRKSSKKIDTLSFAAFHSEVEFLEKIQITRKGINEVHYYFTTPKNYLMRVVVKKSEYGESAWDALVKFGKLKIDSEVVWTFPIKGYDFNVLQCSTTMEITPV